MNIVQWIPVVLISLVSIGSAIGDFMKAPQIYASLKSVGVPDWAFPVLGGLKVAGALGLAVGVAVLPLGLAAAICLSLYYLAAVGAHLRAGQGLKAGAVPLVLAIIAALAALPYQGA
jgi:hypothetical protein